MIKNFVEWCKDKGLVETSADGTVHFKEALKPPVKGTMKDPMKSGKKASGYKDKVDGGRDGKDDLEDYEGHMADNGTVDPFKLKKGVKD